MSHQAHTPSATPAKRRMFRYMMVLTAAAFIAGGVASLPAHAQTVPRAPAVKGHALPCPSGYVWRDGYDGDALCVTPAERDRVHAQNPNRQPGGGVYGPATCKPGYVWREKWTGDTLCVTPAERARARWQGQLIDNGPELTGIPGR
ncbi:hypothetical protein WDV06_09770 [Streptomyces racemochromogenes]|uniref:Secreted protein n=1 Tax=Streptomyces racemochromogenes TaxID=67353 RepID=A0ABW7PAL0_9ACTN